MEIGTVIQPATPPAHVLERSEERAVVSIRSVGSIEILPVSD